MMDRIVARVEQDAGWRSLIDASHTAPQNTTAAAIAAGLAAIGHTIGAKAIVAFTASGSTALRVARERPESPIIGLTPDQDDGAAAGGGVGGACGGDAGCALDDRGGRTARAKWRWPRGSRRMGKNRGDGRGAVRAVGDDECAAGGDGEVGRFG